MPAASQINQTQHFRYHDNQQNMVRLLSTYRLLIALLLLGMHNIELVERRWESVIPSFFYPLC